jgi:transposase
MSLPTTRFTLSHVGTAENQRPDQHAPTRETVPSIGAVSLDSGQFVRMIRPVLGYVTFRTFPRRKLRQQSPGRQMLIVLDNARCHHAKILAGFLRRQGRQLRLFPPPYSPQLASIERAWNLTLRLVTDNCYFATLSEVLKAVSVCFDHWRKPNRVLPRLCCIT